MRFFLVLITEILINKHTLQRSYFHKRYIKILLSSLRVQRWACMITQILGAISDQVDLVLTRGSNPALGSKPALTMSP